MLKLNKQALGKVTQSRTALILFAAAAFTGGTASEASARSYGHHHHYAHHTARTETSPWRDANASINSSFGGRSFSGMASFYGNESGRKTASGQSFNQDAMTAAHRTLPPAAAAGWGGGSVAAGAAGAAGGGSEMSTVPPPVNRTGFAC